jgi:hypothetical protein
MRLLFLGRLISVLFFWRTWMLNDIVASALQTLIFVSANNISWRFGFYWELFTDCRYPWDKLKCSFTDRATKSVPNFLRVEGVAWSEQKIPTAVFSNFLTGAATFSFKQLLSCTHVARWCISVTAIVLCTNIQSIVTMRQLEWFSRYSEKLRAGLPRSWWSICGGQRFRSCP